MAAPHVMGARAFLLGTHLGRRAGSADVLQHMKLELDKVPGMGNHAFTTKYGHGRVRLRFLPDVSEQEQSQLLNQVVSEADAVSAKLIKPDSSSSTIRRMGIVQVRDEAAAARVMQMLGKSELLKSHGLAAERSLIG